MQDTTMSVGSVFAEADVGNNKQRRKFYTQEANGLNYGAFGVVGRGAKWVLGVGGYGWVGGDWGRQKRMTERRPLWTRGARWEMSLLMPRRLWLGREGIRTSSSGWSDTKSGYISIDCKEEIST